MQTHRDDSHADDFMDRLRQRAAKMTRDKASEITAGKEGEEPLAAWKAHDVQCKHMPDDEQGILRISVGGGATPLPLNYCVIRGGVGPCIELLEKAIQSLREAP
jgi:hypothetical protein